MYMHTWRKCYSLEMLSNCMHVIVYYRCIYMFGLSATSQEMLSNFICVVLQVDLKPLSSLHMCFV